MQEASNVFLTEDARAVAIERKNLQQIARHIRVTLLEMVHNVIR
jgi:hypothetical protein